jgi:putative ABC transport system permease protein
VSLLQLALKNISGSAFRSSVIALCALVLASFTLAATLILRGAENSLRLAIDRLGADIIVIPQGSEEKVEGALMMGVPASVWMAQENLQKIAAVPGVAVVSPQLYLSTLHEASCCSVSDMFLVAFDPKTDFTVQPWLKQTVGGSLRLGEAVGGRYVSVPLGEQNIRLYGYIISLRGNLEPTGTGLDQSMFVTFDTARDIAHISTTQAQAPLQIPPDSVSAILVRVVPGSDPHKVAIKILQSVPGVTPIESPNLFQAYRRQMNSLLNTFIIMIAIFLGLSIILLGLVFTMASNERRRELGVLRALGATRSFVLKSLLTEAILLSLSGGLVGIGLTALIIYLFKHLIVNNLGLPFLFPSWLALLVQIGIGLALALVTVTLAALLPAYKVSHQDPAAAMRE